VPVLTAERSMKTMRWLTVVALALGATAAHATNGMRMIGFGPVQESMGGASVGAPLDSATAITNPAGLTGLPARADFGATYFSPDVKGTMSGFGPDQALDSGRPGSPVPAVGVVATADKLSFGLGMWGIAGMGVDNQAFLPDNNGNPLPAMTSYSQMRFTPAVSYALSDMVSVGLTLNGMWAQMEYTMPGTEPHSGASAFGVGAVVGVLVKPLKGVTVGAAYESKSVFQDFVFHVAGGHDKLTFDQPQTATLGAGYRPFDTLLLAADVQWINWSDSMGENKPEFSDATTQAAQMGWNMNWSDQWVFKVGAQYDVTKDVTVRAGYNYGKAPLAKDRVFENALFPAIAEQHITAGLGYAIGPRTAVNVSGMYSPEVTFKTAGQVMTPNGPVDSSNEMKMSQWDVTFGLTFKM
jgi:long-chain fatty acid transport protein